MADPTTPQAPTTTPTPATPGKPEPVTPEIPSAQSEQKPPDFLAPKFAALTKKERQIRQQAQEFKRQQAEFEKARQDFERQRAEWESEFKERPLEAIKKRGRTYDDITQAALNDGKFKPEAEVKDLRSEIEKLRHEQAEKERLAQESAKTRAEQEEQQAIEAFKGQIGEHIAGNKDAFEFINLFQADAMVYETVEEHFKRTQKVLSIPEACELVEKYLESELLERAPKESKKFQAKFAAAKAQEEKKEAGKTSTTLSNNLNTSAAPIMTSKNVDDDRMKRALAALG